MAIGLLVMLSLWLLSVTTDFSGVTDTVGGLVVPLFPAALGASIRYRRIVRSQQFDSVRSRERETLARELHDTVAHHVSAIAIQAQAGRFLAQSGNPAGAADALAVIEAEASRTLTEMRSMVGALRTGEPDAQRSVQQGLADICEMATRAGAAGLAVHVEQEGTFAGLLPSVEAALYRVAQESTTNTKRHARHATDAEIVLTGESDYVRLIVRDNGAATYNPRPAGYGLVGMAERIALLGGTLEAGPDPGPGWTVKATIPRSGVRS